MRPIEVLKGLNLVRWPVLLAGFKRGWVTKLDIADYAISLLAADLDNGDENVAVLPGSAFLDESYVVDLILQIAGSTEDDETLENWRLAKLITLRDSDLSAEEKIERLQYLYAEFDYPEDMASCSIYSQDSVDPLVAMSEVISLLKKKLVGLEKS